MSTPEKNSHFVFLYIALAACFLFLIAVISPFLTTLLLAAILVTGTYPVYEWLLKKVHHREKLSAGIISTAIGVIFSVIFFVFIIFLSNEAVSTYEAFDRMMRQGTFNLSEIIRNASQYLHIAPEDFIASVRQAAEQLSEKIVAQSTNLIKGIVWLFINFFLLVFAMYFFFKDGKFMVNSLQTIIPLPSRYASEIFQKFRQVSLAMLYGIFLTAIAQGILGGVGFAIVGIHNPILWGTVMAFLGMLPIGGTAIVWLPAAIFLFMQGRYVAGVGLLLWGGLIVALVDNFIKPLVISRQAKTYPLATFLVVIGGLMVFGLKGAIIAPMVLAAFVSLTHLYHVYYDRPAGTSID